MKEHANRPTVTLREVASAAKVSLGTASMALSGRPGVSAKTVRHVETVAGRLGYRPHPYVSTLMRQVGGRKQVGGKVNLAWLYVGSESYKVDFARPWGYHSTYAAALNRARELGYNNLEPHWCGQPGISLERLGRILKGRGILGALVVSGTSKIPKLEELKDVTLVKLNSPYLESFNHHVYPDTNQAMLLACSRLWQQGYRRIGLIMGVTHIAADTGSREAAWFNFQNALPEELRIPVLIDDFITSFIFDCYFVNREPSTTTRPPSFLDDEDWLKRFGDERKAFLDGRITQREAKAAINHFFLMKWLDDYRPDVIICIDSRIKGNLQKIGYRVPEDIGIVHLNLKSDTPNWSGIDQHWDNIATLSVDLLDHLIGTGQIGQTDHPVLRSAPGSWVQEKTTLPRKPLVYPEDRYVNRWIKERLNTEKSGSG